jgi:hypothetical protein
VVGKIKDIVINCSFYILILKNQKLIFLIRLKDGSKQRTTTKSILAPI